MNYTVIWLMSVEAELAEIWRKAEDRGRVESAVAEINAVLSSSPSSAGESRDEDERIYLSAPLGINYRVSEAERVVRIFSVWRFRSPS